MIPYVLLFCVAGIPALFYSHRPNRVLWAMAWLIYVLFIGLRHDVGGDWDGYLMITQRIAEGTLQESWRDQEVLFSLITWCSTRLGFGVYGANLFGAVLFCTGLFAFCARLPNRWLALATATPFLVVVAVMSANRQGMAIGVILMVMARWGQLSLLMRTLGILAAGMLHNSALFLLLLVVVDLRVNKFLKAVMMICIAALAVWLASRSEAAWHRYTNIYATQSSGAYSPGAIFHLLLNLVPAILMMAGRRRWARLAPNWPLLHHLCLLSFALFAMSPFFTVPVGRMSLYLFPISISFLAYLPLSMRNGSGRALTRTISVVAMSAVLVLWLTFANTAFTYLPYKSVLTVSAWELKLPR